jgi:HEAT repeat protein
MRIPTLAVICLIFLCTAGFAAGETGTYDDATDQALGEMLAAGYTSHTLADLDKLGLTKDDAVAWLIDLIENDTDRYTRTSACDWLAAMGPDAADAVPVLTEILVERERLSDWMLIEAAIKALGAIGTPYADDAAPIILQILIENGDYEEQPYIPSNLDPDRRYPKGDKEVFRAAYNAFNDNGVNPKPLLISGFGDPKGAYQSPWRDITIATALAKIGKDVVPYIDAALEDESFKPESFSGCMMTLMKLRGEAAPAVQPLMDLYKRFDAVGVAGGLSANYFDTYIIMVLGSIGPDASEAVPFLIEQTKGDDVNKIAGAIRSLGQIADERALPVLIKALDDDRLQQSFDYNNPNNPTQQPMIKRNAVFALRNFKEKAIAAAPKLVTMLGNGDKYFRIAVSVALGNIGTDAAPITVEALSSEDPLVREDAARALGYMGEGATATLDILIGALKTEKAPEVKEAMAFAIGAIGRAGLDDTVENPIDILIGLLGDDSWQVRQSAASSLGLFGALAEKALPKLEDMAANDPYSDAQTYRFSVREVAQDAIERINPLSIHYAPVEVK